MCEMELEQLYQDVLWLCHEEIYPKCLAQSHHSGSSELSVPELITLNPDTGSGGSQRAKDQLVVLVIYKNKIKYLRKRNRMSLVKKTGFYREKKEQYLPTHHTNHKLTSQKGLPEKGPDTFELQVNKE